MSDAAPASRTSRWPPPRALKFRQAAMAYVHVGLLYEFAVVAMWQAGLLPDTRGPIALWLLLGAAIVGLVVWGLWSWQNAWFARVLWLIHSLRLPALIGGAFFPGPEARLAPGFYVTALVVVVANLWMLARAGWDV